MILVLKVYLHSKYKTNAREILTPRCWGRALRPKSDIFMFPFASIRIFSGCNKQKLLGQKLWSSHKTQPLTVSWESEEVLVELLKNHSPYGPLAIWCHDSCQMCWDLILLPLGPDDKHLCHDNSPQHQLSAEISFFLLVLKAFSVFPWREKWCCTLE